MVTMPDFGFDCVSSILAEFTSIFFFNFFFNFFFVLQHVRKPDTTDSTDSTRAVQGACYVQPAGYNASHACRLPAEQEATPHACDSLSALYYCGGFLFNTSSWLLLLSAPAICKPACLRTCDACCHRYYSTTQIFHNVVI